MLKVSSTLLLSTTGQNCPSPLRLRGWPGVKVERNLPHVLGVSGHAEVRSLCESVATLLHLL